MELKGDASPTFDQFSKEMDKRLKADRKDLLKGTERDVSDEVGNENSRENTNWSTVTEDDCTGMVEKLNNSENGVNTTLKDCSNSSKFFGEKNRDETFIKKPEGTEKNNHIKTNFNIVHEDPELAKKNHVRSSKNVGAINVMILGMT